MISAYNFILTKGKKIICGGGFHFVHHDGKMRHWRKHNDKVTVAEGYASFVYHYRLSKKIFLII